MTNLLAGAGPMPQGGAGAQGPSPGLASTLGAAPQAAPQTTSGAPQNMLSGAQPQGQPGARPVAPPSREKMAEAIQKESFITGALKELLGIPDLSAKDILDTVGNIVAEQVMSPFQAAQSLKDLPSSDDSLTLRQWVANHYVRSMQSLQTVSEMMGAHGAMTRGIAPGGQPQVPQPASTPMAQQNG